MDVNESGGCRDLKIITSTIKVVYMSCDVQDSNSSDATCEEEKKGLNLIVIYRKLSNLIHICTHSNLPLKYVLHGR